MTKPESDMGAGLYAQRLAESNAFVMGLAAQQAAERRAAEARQAELDAWRRTEERREKTREQVAELEQRALESRHRQMHAVFKMADDSIKPGSFLHGQIVECCWRLVDQGAPRTQLPEWTTDSEDEHFRKASDMICFGITRGNRVILQPTSRLFNPFNEGRIAKAEHFSSDASEIQHVLTHEAMHGLRNARLGADQGRWFQWGDAERAIAGRVSEYSRESAAEFCAELGTAMVFGKRFDPEVMRLAKAVAAWTPPTVEIEPPVPLVDIKQVADGFKVTFSEQVEPTTASDPKSYVLLERYHVAQYPELHDVQQYVPITRVELAADGLSALLIVAPRKADDEGRSVIHQLYCPGVRPLQPVPPAPGSKGESAQPAIHVYVPAPQVTVNMPEMKQPNIVINPTLSVPPRSTRTSVKRDDRGRIVETSAEEHDAE